MSASVFFIVASTIYSIKACTPSHSQCRLWGHKGIKRGLSKGRPGPRLLSAQLDAKCKLKVAFDSIGTLPIKRQLLIMQRCGVSTIVRRIDVVSFSQTISNVNDSDDLIFFSFVADVYYADYPHLRRLCTSLFFGQYAAIDPLRCPIAAVSIPSKNSDLNGDMLGLVWCASRFFWRPGQRVESWKPAAFFYTAL